MGTHQYNEPIGTRSYPGSRPELMPIGRLTPEDARWVQPPSYAWRAVEARARASLGHSRLCNDFCCVGEYCLTEFMDDVLGEQWHQSRNVDGTVRDYQLQRLRDRLEAGHWVVLGWQPRELWPVAWDADPERENDGQWRVRDDAWQLGMPLQRALQSRLDEAYRVRRVRAGSALDRSRVPGDIETDGTMSPRRTARPRRASIDMPEAMPTKAQRWQARKRLIAAGRDSSSQRARGAAERLARNNVAVEKARLADHVYSPSGSVPEGWVNRSGDEGILRMYKLKDEDLAVNGSNFRAQLYEPDSSVFGNDMKPTLAFKGTDMTSLEDLSNNFKQSLDMESPYYEKSVNIGEKLRDAGESIDITGHSQGGGLCAAASVASGKDCWSFNAAGLHPKTVERYGGHIMPSNINAYHVKGEVLTLIQQWTLLPDAVGTSYELSGNGLPLSRHSIKQVIEGIEKQKFEDIFVLEATS